MLCRDYMEIMFPFPYQELVSRSPGGLVSGLEVRYAITAVP